MNRKMGGFIVVLFIAVSCLSTVKVCRASDVQKKVIYSGYIDTMIVTCESKIRVCDSRSRSICDESALYTLKESFLRTNKSELVQEMIEQNVGIKPYQMTYFLNKRFFEVLRRVADHCQRPGTVSAMN
jgi:hypothetical protein